VSRARRTSDWRQRLNPFCWWGQPRQVRRAEAIADWLHNLPLYAAVDFAGFDEKHLGSCAELGGVQKARNSGVHHLLGNMSQHLWQGYQGMLDNHPASGLEGYRSEFEQRASSEKVNKTEPGAKAGRGGR
jgi:hypothetical protein